MNAGIDRGAMPVNVFVKVRATVTAGFAKLVDDVNQYAAPIYAPTANGATDDRPDRAMPNTTSTSPAVATISPNHSPPPERVLVDHSTAGSEYMRLASIAPQLPPEISAGMSARRARHIIQRPRFSPVSRPASARAFVWWLIVGCDLPSGSSRSQEQTSPPSATRLKSRSRTGSASAPKTRASSAASASARGETRRGAQQTPSSSCTSGWRPARTVHTSTY